MSIRPSDLISPLSVLMCQPLLAALGSESSVVLKPVGSLPAPCFQLPDRRAIVAATPINGVGIFRAEMIATAIANNVDVALIRHGSWPETIDELSIDVVLGRGRPGQMLWRLFPYRSPRGDYWLVPPQMGAGPSIRADETGLSVSPTLPYHDADERADGVARAARETILAVRRLRHS